MGDISQNPKAEGKLKLQTPGEGFRMGVFL